MTDLADSGQVKAFKDTLHLGQSNEVMHTNYFLQQPVLTFISKSLQW